MADEGPQQKLVGEQAGKNLAYAAREVPKDAFGSPMVEISAAATELVPTVQYGNVTIGPVIVRRWVPDGEDDYLLKQIHKTQTLCERAVAEDRESVHAMLRGSSEGRLQTG
jgi:hypothetical protein